MILGDRKLGANFLLTNRRRAFAHGLAGTAAEEDTLHTTLMFALEELMRGCCPRSRRWVVGRGHTPVGGGLGGRGQ